VLSKIQLICKTLFPPQMSVTITFLTYSSYTSQYTAIFIPVYLFIARQCDHGYYSNHELTMSVTDVQ